MNTLTITAPTTAPTTTPTVAPSCPSCGATSAPDGACMNIGACQTADNTAARHGAGATSKYAVPAAWNAAGRVD